MADLSKADLYRKLGYGGDALAYEAVLSQANLTNPRKSRINTDKVSQVESLLENSFMRVCNRGDCKAEAGQRQDGRTITPASDQSMCEVCSGSVNRAAVDRMVQACESVGWSRLCVVGGSPNTREELGTLVRHRLDLRLIDGTVSRTRSQADPDLAWADRVVIWGQTELSHKVSALYHGPNVILIARKGIAELASAVSESVARR